MRLSAALSLAPILVLAACAPPPEARQALPPPPPDGAYPGLLPQSEIAALPAGPPAEGIAANAALAARAAALRRRAAAL